MYRKTYIEINSENLIHNLKEIKNNFNDYQYYFAVVKGNAYGHGFGIVKILIENGINYLAVASLEEALEIREILSNTQKNFHIQKSSDSLPTVGQTFSSESFSSESRYLNIPILIMQPIHEEEIKIAAENNITITVTNLNYFKNIYNLNLENKIKIHIKLNTGMNRLGITEAAELEDLFKFYEEKNFENIEIEGVFSHFATSGIFDDYYEKQLEKFYELLKNIDLEKIKIIHFDRSLTILNKEKIDIVNGVRIGISLYGYDMSPKITEVNWNKVLHIKSNLKNFLKNIKIKDLDLNSAKINLKPCLSFFSEIIEIRKVKKNDYGNYGNSIKFKKDMIIGIVSTGYTDGFMRKNRDGFVFINNKKYKILGMINMSMIFIEIDNTVNLYDKVELIGQHIKAKEVGDRCETNVYEVVTNLKKEIPRILK